MARISELHYSNAYARNSGVAEFLEVALGPLEDPADFTVSFYQDDGSFGNEFVLTDPRITFSVDPDNGEKIYVLSADNLPILLTDPNGGGSTNYDAYALTNTSTVPGTVVDFYDIGGGSTGIIASGGAANGAVSENVPVLTGPEAATTTLQWNQPNPDTLTYETVGAGDTGIACFTSGTLIETASGLRMIEDLKAGDFVQTADHGLQRLRWVGQREVEGRGAFAPVLIRAGTFGATRDLRVSPQHRILMAGWRTELMFGEAEVLVPAKALINGHSVQTDPADRVTYVHLLFDSHHILSTHGVLSESFYPGAYIMGQGVAEAKAEVASLFPELTRGADHQLEAARYLCTVQEGRALSQTAQPHRV